jgi:hypothetical protein
MTSVSLSLIPTMPTAMRRRWFPVGGHRFHDYWTISIQHPTQTKTPASLPGFCMIEIA